MRVAMNMWCPSLVICEVQGPRAEERMGGVRKWAGRWTMDGGSWINGDYRLADSELLSIGGDGRRDGGVHGRGGGRGVDEGREVF